eukprot:TRINITY_DN3329_c0_g3_i1.p1 TRINITY_DN3329_c0_g3~~TRINITY_DN3329_c0_g3_i1.p1  ORF type:complete len:377 (+),score=77.42 TRINITY_DN3329_c0_g3_i1:104-1234(+)
MAISLLLNTRLRQMVCVTLCVQVLLGLYWEWPVLRSKLDEGDFDQSVNGKMMVVYAMKDVPLLGLLAQGMFADFFHVLGALKYGERKGAAGVRVQFETEIYVNKTGDNYWGYFFEPTMMIDSSAVNPPEAHFNKYLARFGMLGTFTNQAIGKRPLMQPFPLMGPCGKPCGIEALNGLVKKYIRVKPEIMSQVDAFADLHFKDKFVIGVHFRGTDKNLVCADCIPAYDNFATIIDRVKTHIPKGQEFVIFVASDENDVIEWLAKRYPRVVAVENGPRLWRNNTETWNGAHKASIFTPWHKASSAIIDCLLLARAKYLIKNRSSVSDVALLFNANPQIPWSFILSDELIYHFKGDELLHTGLLYPSLRPERPDAPEEI